MPLPAAKTPYGAASLIRSWHANGLETPMRNSSSSATDISSSVIGGLRKPLRNLYQYGTMSEKVEESFDSDLDTKIHCDEQKLAQIIRDEISS
jgi:hypothetical protein